MPDAVEPIDVLDTAEAGGMVVRGGALRVLGFGAGTILSLGGVVLLTRHLGVGDYGRYQTVVSFIAIVQAVTDVGMATLGVREYAQRVGPDRDRLMRILLGLRIVVTTIGVAIAALLVAAGGYGGELVLGTVLMGLGLVIVLLQTTVQIPLAAELRLGTITAIDVFRQAFAAALIALLVLADAGLVPFLASTIPVHLAILVWTALLVRGRIPSRPTFDLAEWRTLLRPAIAVALATTVGTIYLYTAQILTSLIATQEETGLFSASFRVFIIAAAVPGILVTSAFPLLSRAARDDAARLANVVRGMFEASLLLGGGALVVLVLGAAPIIDVIGGSDYSGAAPVLRVQALTLFVTFCLATFGFTMLALHRHRPLVLMNGLALVVMVIAVPILISIDGEVGAAWATLIGEATLLAGYVAVLAVDRPELRPRIAPVVRVLVAIAIGLAPVLTGLPDTVEAVLGGVLYVVAALVVGAVPPGVLEQVPAPLRARLTRSR